MQLAIPGNGKWQLPPFFSFAIVLIVISIFSSSILIGFAIAATMVRPDRESRRRRKKKGKKVISSDSSSSTTSSSSSSDGDSRSRGIDPYSMKVPCHCPQCRGYQWIPQHVSLQHVEKWGTQLNPRLPGNFSELGGSSGGGRVQKDEEV